jgi:hypothetical protein
LWTSPRTSRLMAGPMHNAQSWPLSLSLLQGRCGLRGLGREVVMIKLCKICGKPFDAINSAKTCSRKCSKAIKKVYDKARNQTPKYKDYNKAYRKKPERKAYDKARKQTPKYKAYLKARNQTPELKAYMKAYRQTPKHKAYMRDYMRDYMRAYYILPPSTQNFFQLINAVNAIKQTQTQNENTKIANNY